VQARVRVSLALMLAALAFASVRLAEAQPAASSPASASAPEIEHAAAPRATLVVRHRTLTVFRSMVAGYQPSERAELARHRVETLLGRDSPGVVAVEPTPEGSMITVDGSLAFMVTRRDVDSLEGESTEAAAAESAQVLRKLIAEAREARDLHALGKAGAIAVALTAAYAALLWGLVRASRFIGSRLLSAASSHAHRLRMDDVPLFESSRMGVFVRRIVVAVVWILALVLTYGWISRLLQLLPFTRAWGERLDGFLIDLVEGIGGGIVEAVPTLTIAFTILLLARFVTQLLRRIFDHVEAGRITLGWLDADTVGPTRRLVLIGVWLFALAMAYPYLPGSNTEAFKGLSVLVGLMISIGGASVVGQALSGLILMYTHTFRIGDYVSVDQHEGTVVSMGVYQTRIRTGLGEELTLPSSLVLGSVTRNYSRPTRGRGFILDTVVTIGYDVPWRQVHAMLLEAARRTPGLSPEHEARVFQTALSDFYVEYRLVTLALPETPRSRAELLGRLHENVQDVFNEHGVQIMSPHYQFDPDEAKLVPRARWYERPAVPDDAQESPGEGAPASR
jgi:small-conductance mechanosensitive channel